jgi:hypothetical protein
MTNEDHPRCRRAGRGGVAGIAAGVRQEAARLGADLTPMGAEGRQRGRDNCPAGLADRRPRMPALRVSSRAVTRIRTRTTSRFTDRRLNMSKYAANLTAPGHKALLSAQDELLPLCLHAPQQRSAAHLTRSGQCDPPPSSREPARASGRNRRTPAVGHRGDLEPSCVIAPTSPSATSRQRQSLVGHLTSSSSDETMVHPCAPGATEAALDNVIVLFIQGRQRRRALRAGLLVQDMTKQEQRRAWLYNPGQRRVRRAPNVAFDNPEPARTGFAPPTSSSLQRQPGALRLEAGRQAEIVVPYNAYKLHSNRSERRHHQAAPRQQDLARYELHRVWVVDATLRRASATSTSAARSTSTRTRGDSRGGLLRRSRPALAHQEGHSMLLRRADLLDHARADRPAGGPCLTRPRQRGRRQSTPT